MLARSAVLARSSARSSAAAAAVPRGMQQKKKAGKSKKKRDDDGDEGSMAAVERLMTPPAPRDNPPLTEAELDERAAAVKKWARYTIRKEHEWNKRMAAVARERTHALDELKVVNPKLYYAALEPDRTPWPLHFPVPTETPPIEDYSTKEAVKI